MNNEYLNNSELKNYIENNHEWDIERGADDGNCNSAYKVNAAVALLSYSEWITYKNIIGSKDTQSWWLRTPCGINAEGSDGFVVNADGGKAIIARSTNKTAEVRPVFYVSRDFIKDVKIDTEKTGQRVKNLILKYFTASELYKSGYTVSEIEQLGYETEAKITSASLSGGTQTGYPLTLSYESVGICSDIKITWQYASMKNGNYAALTRDSVPDSDINTYTIKPEDRRKYVKCIITPVNADGEDAAAVETNIAGPLPKSIGPTGGDLDGKLSSTTAETPSKYTFSVDGQEFILLDIDANGDAIVLAKDYYGTKAYTRGSNMRFDPTDKKILHTI